MAKDGSRLGQVERMVVDERAHRVTHLVVGDRAVEAGHFKDAGPDGLATDLDRAAMETMPRAGQPPFSPPGEHWVPPTGYSLGAFLNFIGSLGSLVGQAPYEPPVELDLGDQLHEITSGSPVWHGEERIGEIERLQTDDAGEVTELVIRRRNRSLVLPVAHVSDVHGNNVRIDIPAAEVDRLQEFDPRA